MKKTDAGILAVAALIIVAVVVVIANRGGFKTGFNTKPDNDVLYNNYTQEGQEGVDQTPDEAPAAEPATTPSARLTYSEALKIYGSTGNGFRYQFSANCQAIPTKLSMKKGTKFMIDNRDTVAHTITIGSQSFRLGKYGFAIVTSKDVGDYAIKCDGINRTQILVSK